MSLTKTQLIGKIYKAFEAVALDDGIGLFEGRALDDRLKGTKAYGLLKAKDERLDWQKIPVIRLYECSTSQSFLDAKGMRFHLPFYLLFALDVFMDEEDILHEEKNFKLFPPEVYFMLSHNLESDYSKKRFSLLNQKQIDCIIHFLEYQLSEKDTYCKKYGVKQAPRFNKQYKELQDVIAYWKGKVVA